MRRARERADLVVVDTPLKARGVSQFADGPVSEFYQTFVNNRRQFDEAKARYAKGLARDAVDANDMFEPHTFMSVAEAQVVQTPT